MPTHHTPTLLPLSSCACVHDIVPQNHLSWSWRDFAFSRARRMLTNMLNLTWQSARKLATCRTKECRGMQVSLMLRLLSALDAREHIITRYNAYPIERYLSSDSIENLFSELVQGCGYMAPVSVCLAVMRKVERRALSKWDGSILQCVICIYFFLIQCFCGC
eukprot:SAG25_NODE_380_length_8808_cov_3.861523_9_plen_162_part_00